MVHLLVTSGENMFLALKETRQLFLRALLLDRTRCHSNYVTINVLSDSIL